MPKYIFVLLILFTTACSVSVRVPGNRFQTSETIGETKRPFLGAGLAGMGRVQFSPNYSRTLIDEKNPDIMYSRSLHLSGITGVTPRFDIGVVYNNDSSFGLMGKWQFLKHSLTDSLKLSSAVVLSIGVSSDKSEENSGRPSSLNMEFGLGDMGLLLGLRVSPKHLFYSGAYLCNMDYEGKHTLHGQTYPLDGSISCDTVTYGWEFATSEKHRWILEGASTQIRTSDSTGVDRVYQKKRTINVVGFKHNWGF